MTARTLSKWVIVILSGSLSAVVILASLVSTFSDYKITVNITDSVDGWVFLMKKGVPESISQGDLVGFYPPSNKYYDKTWFLKVVAGMPGDVVATNDGVVTINGAVMGIIKQRSKSGDLLEAAKGGVIPPGKIFVWTPHPDSFDSRYRDIGLIDVKDILGTARRIF